MPAPTRLFQPSRHVLLCLFMAQRTALRDCHFSTGDSFQERNALLHALIAGNIHHIGTGQTVLCDQDWLLVALCSCKGFGRLTLERGDSSVRMQ